MQLPDAVQLRLQRLAQLGAVADLLGDDVAGARQGVGSGFHALLRVYIIFRGSLGVGAVPALLEEQVRQGLQALFLCHGRAGAALLLVGAVKILQLCQSPGAVDGGGQLLGQLALLLDGGEDGFTPLLQGPEVLQAGFQVAQHGVVHGAVHLLAVARNKRNGVPLVQKGYNIPDIINLLPQLFRQCGYDALVDLFFVFHVLCSGFLI